MISPRSVRRLAAAASLAAMALFAWSGANARPGPPPRPYRLALRAMLFYTDKGTFSPDLVAHPVDLWNTPAGEGRAGGSSNATLVVVVVTGEPGSYIPERKVELTASEGTRTVLQRSVETSVLNTQGKAYAAFWIYDTGCRRLRLSARVTGQTPAGAPVTATIPFACGE
ncbi:MAG: hypothetical protein JO306_00090 [Gemmatimonadetes bacterium]|nr:hypothetical protein [Gemmatimonadota bacterium]